MGLAPLGVRLHGCFRMGESFAPLTSPAETFSKRELGFGRLRPHQQSPAQGFRAVRKIAAHSKDLPYSQICTEVVGVASQFVSKSGQCAVRISRIQQSAPI